MAEYLKIKDDVYVNLEELYEAVLLPRGIKTYTAEEIQDEDS